MAEYLFGSTDIVGQTLLIGDRSAQIRGVFQSQFNLVLIVARETDALKNAELAGAPAGDSREMAIAYVTSAGLAPLAMDGGLSAAADARCESFVAGGPFDHSGMTTRSEICAAGPIGSASAVCSNWQGSPAHYANIMEPSFTSMGVACWFCSTADGQYTYWTVTFN